MPQKLRVFISSTMEDLANEREAVVARLKAFNLEPVNAEGLLPTGETSWNVIEDEIRSSHIFVLILGEFLRLDTEDGLQRWPEQIRHPPRSRLGQVCWATDPPILQGAEVLKINRNGGRATTGRLQRSGW